MESPHPDIDLEVSEQYRLYGGELLRYATSLAGNPEVARDAVQDVFVRYFVDRRYGRLIASPRAWLYRVLHNCLVDRMRASATRKQEDPESLESLPAATADPEEAARDSETARTILSVLSPRELACLRLHAEGLTYDEISSVLGIQPGTVGALLARVRRKLQQTANSPPKRSLQELSNAIRYLLLDALVHSSV